MSKSLPPPLRGLIPIESAGFVGPGRPSPREAVEVALESGVDLSSHRSKLLTPALVTAANLIVVMDNRQRRDVCSHYRQSPTRVLLLGDLDPLPIDTRAICDPFDQPKDVFRSTYARIDRCLVQLARVVAAA
jgi:protein-tyrosine phosphatase